MLQSTIGLVLVPFDRNLKEDRQLLEFTPTVIKMTVGLVVQSIKRLYLRSLEPRGVSTELNPSLWNMDVQGFGSSVKIVVS